VCFRITEPPSSLPTLGPVYLFTSPLSGFTSPLSVAYTSPHCALLQSLPIQLHTSTPPRLATPNTKRVGMFTIRASLALGLGLIQTCAGLSSGSFIWPELTQQCVVSLLLVLVQALMGRHTILPSLMAFLHGLWPLRTPCQLK